MCWLIAVLFVGAAAAMLPLSRADPCDAPPACLIDDCQQLSCTGLCSQALTCPNPCGEDIQCYVEEAIQCARGGCLGCPGDLSEYVLDPGGSLEGCLGH
jgi:hypothetical protein